MSKWPATLSGFWTTVPVLDALSPQLIVTGFQQLRAGF
jgi:hypothetical protein